jgi:hypothetical protein
LTVNDDFARRWKKLFETCNGYVDEATKTTLANFASGKNPEDPDHLPPTWLALLALPHWCTATGMI